MSKRIYVVGYALCAAMGITSCASSSTAREAEVAKSVQCHYDSAAVLSLSEDEFDQNQGSGWRAVANIPGCELTAAAIIHDYRQSHPKASSLLYWHEGQLYATTGDNKTAIQLMNKSRKDPQVDLAGWNAYVDATVAFLRGNRQEFDEANSRLLATKASPELPPVKDGKITIDGPDGKPMTMVWPPNRDVAVGLKNCFGQPYKVAYGPECRKKSQ